MEFKGNVAINKQLLATL